MFIPRCQYSLAAQNDKKGGRFAKIGVVKLKCYYKPVGAFFERPPVFVNDPYEQGNGFP